MPLWPDHRGFIVMSGPRGWAPVFEPWEDTAP
jgi:hypothetical protein